MWPLIGLVLVGIVLVVVAGLVRLAEPGLAFFPSRGEAETPAVRHPLCAAHSHDR